MKIFITGGTGFIGKFVVKELHAKNHQLLLLSRKPEQKKIKNITTIIGDLQDIKKWQDAVNVFQPECAVHLAWEGIPDYGVEMSMKNLFYGVNLFSILGEIGCKKIICAGSFWEYNDLSGKLNEKSPLNLSEPFPMAKNILHFVGEKIAKEHNIKFIWTRLFYPYGPGQKASSLIPTLIANIRAGKEPDIKTPNIKNDFIFVGDVAQAIVMLTEKGKKTAIYNIGSGKAVAVKFVVHLIYQMFHRQFPHYENGQKNSTWADISAISRDIGWKPTTSLNDGIKETIKFF